MDALATARDAAVQMIDTSVVRVHQHGACIAGNREQHMGRSRGGLTSKIHAVVDAAGFLDFVLQCFRQKRKTIRNNLSGIWPRVFLESLPDTARRAEELSIPEFVDLYDRLRKGSGPS